MARPRSSDATAGGAPVHGSARRGDALDAAYLRDDHDLMLWESMRVVRVASLPRVFSNRGLVADWDLRFGPHGWDPDPLE